MIRKVSISLNEAIRYAESSSCDEDEIVEIIQAWARERHSELVEADYKAATERVLERIKAVFADVTRVEGNMSAFADSGTQDKFKELPIAQQEKILAILNGEEEDLDDDAGEQENGDQTGEPCR